MCFMCISAASCPALTVANSDTTTFEGNTADTRLVTCSNGYSSSVGVTFTSSCDGTGPGASDWSNQLTCDGIACIEQVLSISYPCQLHLDIVCSQRALNVSVQCVSSLCFFGRVFNTHSFLFSSYSLLILIHEHVICSCEDLSFAV